MVTTSPHVAHTHDMEAQPLDFYCERLGPEFWAEPLNAWSNLGFILIGTWGILQYRKIQNGSYAPLLFGVLIVFVGLGSFLFHTVADSRTHWGDLIPIFLFASGYLFYSYRHLLNHRLSLAITSVTALICSMAAIEILIPKSILNGSLLYLPPLVMLLYVAFKSKNKTYLAAATLFFISLIFRTTDQLLCEALPIGTHFLWHIINSIVLGLLLKISLNASKASVKI